MYLPVMKCYQNTCCALPLDLACHVLAECVIVREKE